MMDPSSADTAGRFYALERRWFRANRIARVAQAGIADGTAAQSAARETLAHAERVKQRIIHRIERLEDELLDDDAPGAPR